MYNMTGLAQGSELLSVAPGDRDLQQSVVFLQQHSMHACSCPTVSMQNSTSEAFKEVSSIMSPPPVLTSIGLQVPAGRRLH